MLGKKGSILILMYAVIFVLLSLSAAVIGHSIIERKAFEITLQRTEAFYISEAGLDNALAILKSNQSYAGTSSPVSVYRGTTVLGQYETTVTDIGSSRRLVTVTSYVPQKTIVSGVLRQTVKAEAIARIATTPPPANFYDYAIYSAGDIEFTGNSYEVTGDVIYATSLSNGGRISGTVTHDMTISPLTHFDFQALRNKAISQNNLYTAARLDAGDPFPTTFLNAVTGEPNVVYVEGDMELSGNITAGGFFLVVGNVLTDPTVTSDTEISGNVTVNGAIYSTGEFELNGGGNALNVNGGIWAGEEAEFKGNAKVSYNSGYMTAIKNLVDSLSSVTVQLLSWRQLELYN